MTFFPSSLYVLSQLLTLLPWLALYVVGFCVAASFLKYCRTPALLTMAATAILAVMLIVQQATTDYVVSFRSMHEGSSMNVSQTLAAANGLYGLVRVAATTLLLVAVFHGRRDAYTDRITHQQSLRPRP